MRKSLYLLLNSLRGFPVAKYYREFSEEDTPEATERRLAAMLQHCRRNVPYYSAKMADPEEPWVTDPRGYRDDASSHQSGYPRTLGRALRRPPTEKRLREYVRRIYGRADSASAGQGLFSSSHRCQCDLLRNVRQGDRPA